ncbi:hypothetical protein AW168_33045 [Nocardia brasiliensis]|uniref:Uncharacterized protein n=1 Tax=Nocardia brasiliensis (strain ATCC 700358 / HUJEG-1) TaxID=1133849 RepID=K0EZH9_NOCB7|nr:hypothetical protein O3I_024830 [Nocardia brasiliensis ATCC 700358]OCF85993.1 hypothetical protein AW168_33045 [Nocardia brasiliensis]
MLHLALHAVTVADRFTAILCNCRKIFIRDFVELVQVDAERFASLNQFPHPQFLSEPLLMNPR